MGYERDTGRHYRDFRDRGDSGRGREDHGDRHSQSQSHHRGDERGYRGGQDQGDDRGFLDRAGDEVRSWFGDDEAERRRRWDERNRGRDEQSQYGDGGRFSSGPGGYESARLGGAGYARPNPDFGAGRGAGATMNYGLGSGADHDGWGQDPNYSAWRRRQVEALDRDYDEYRRENEQRFHHDFGTWRTNREGQRQSLRQAQEQQEVIGSDGAHVGVVDHVRGDRILLTKNDKDAGGHHHSIPSAWIVDVGDKVRINRTAAQAQAAWNDEEPGDGPHNLNKAFPGTY